MTKDKILKNLSNILSAVGIILAIAGIAYLGYIMSVGDKKRVELHKAQVEAECEQAGGKFVITYDKYYHVDKVTCFPAGITTINQGK